MKKISIKVEPLLLTIKEAAEMLNLSTRSIDYLRADGRLKYKKHGDAIRIPVAEVNRLSKIDIGPIRPRTNNHQKAVKTNG